MESEKQKGKKQIPHPAGTAGIRDEQQGDVRENAREI